MNLPRQKQLPQGRFHNPEDLHECCLSNYDIGACDLENPGGVYRITRSVYNEIEKRIGNQPAETGGMLGGNRETGIVTHFHFDESASCSAATYSPDYQTLSQLLSEDWNPKGINLLGFVHSHPGSMAYPSGGDMTYASRILASNSAMQNLLMPIVVTKPNAGRFELVPFSAVRQGRSVEIQSMKFEIIDDESIEPRPDVDQYSEELIDYSASWLPKCFPLKVVAGSEDPSVRILSKLCMRYHHENGRPWTDTSNTFQRVIGAYDLERLSRCRVIYVGMGGAACFAEELARAGVGEHVLIDGDVVSESNLATQQTYREDIGRQKVDCVSERILSINPNAAVSAVPRFLDDNYTDTEFQSLVASPLRSGLVYNSNALPKISAKGVLPEVVLLCGLTDSFEAQARINRLALQYGIPALCAQVYASGEGAEVTFSHPDVTPACQRCVLGSRYRAYLEQNFQNNVTSDGTPIFSTTRLNAIKGFVGLALLQHGSKHPRWNQLLQRIGNRNLIQIRMSPELPLDVFDRVFGGGDQSRQLFDETVWLPQQPEGLETNHPTCPDCRATGNLLDAMGTFSDTRELHTK